MRASWAAGSEARTWEPIRCSAHWHSRRRERVSTWACSQAFASPSLARRVRTEAALGVSPRSLATSAADWPSTSTRHSTDCHRFGSVRKASVTNSWSAMASSKLTSPEASSSTSSSVGTSRERRPQVAARLRMVVRR